MEKIAVPEDYQCPLCPDHYDDNADFHWSNLLNAPICRGCTYDIHYGLVGLPEKPTMNEYNYAHTIDLLEKLVKGDFQRIKFSYLKELIQEIIGTVPDFLEGIKLPDLADDAIHALNEKMDYELVKLQLTDETNACKPTLGDLFEKQFKWT